MSTLNETLKPLSSTDIANLVAQGRADEIVTHMQAYERQQKAISEGVIKLSRLTVKKNKAEGLYISHPSMADTMKGGCNFNRHMLPAVQALINDDDLRQRVKDFFESGVEVDTNVLR